MPNNEVFTPIEYIKSLDDKFKNIDGPVLDPCCGHGVWLKYAQQKGFDVYGCDISEDNCRATIKNLYGDGEIKTLGQAEIPEIMKGPGLINVFSWNNQLIENIVQADSLIYSMNFNKTKTPISFGNNLFTID